MSDEKQKKVGKFLITLEGNLRDTWSSLGLRNIMWYEVIVYFGQKKWVVEKGSYDNKALAVKAYSNIKTVSDVHKYLNALNPTDRTLSHYDARMTYNR